MEARVIRHQEGRGADEGSGEEGSGDACSGDERW
jgi:hypothetical protein